jgi:glucose-1-phosphate adenylyltransferase
MPHGRRDETLCIILAGGVGKRLYPLTADRSKPSVPFGGKYRIIDFTLSNCLHSGVRRVLVLTQYKSHSLQKHLRDGWSVFNPEIGEYITPVPPQMRTGDSWYSGTADAIYQNRYLIERSGARRILILSGDHIYRMDYAAMLNQHHKTRADLSVACMVVPLELASGFGVMEVDEQDHIREFVEKPGSPKPLPDDPQHALASMGIYVFEAELLCEQLVADHNDPSSSHDFGKDLLPKLIKTHHVFGYRFGGVLGRVSRDNYWRDVGTIDAYYEANMDLLKPIPPLDLYQDTWSIRTYQAQHPPARVVPNSDGGHGELHNSILGSGSVVVGATLRNSILSPRVHIESGAVVESSILLDGVHVGAGATVRRCIIDKQVNVPANTQIGVDLAKDATWFTVSSNGIVVVPERFSWQSTLPLRDTDVAGSELG